MWPLLPIPSVIPAKLVAYAALALAIFAAGFVGGLRMESKRFNDYLEQQTKASVALVVKQGEISERVVTRYFKKAAEAEIRTVTIEKEVVRYAGNNLGACIDPDWVRLHNAAVANALP